MKVIRMTEENRTAVMEVVLISGLSLLASVEETGDGYVLHNPFAVTITPPNSVTLLPIAKLSRQPVDRIFVHKNMVLTVQDVPTDIVLNYSRAIGFVGDRGDIQKKEH